MAPEVFLGAAYSFPVDVYSGAMVMAFIISGGVGLAGIEGAAVAELAVRVSLRPSLVHVKGAEVSHWGLVTGPSLVHVKGAEERQAYTHTRARTHTHTHARAHTHTHARTHGRNAQTGVRIHMYCKCKDPLHRSEGFPNGIFGPCV